jgi:hypothetical protein
MDTPSFIIEEITDPNEIARSKALAAKVDPNLDWLETHWANLLPQARGKYVAVAGREAFVAESSAEAIRLARLAHPEEDEGLVIRYVRLHQGPRLYGNRG